MTTTLKQVTIGWLKINAVVETLAAVEATAKGAERQRRIKALRRELEAI